MEGIQNEAQRLKKKMKRVSVASGKISSNLICVIRVPERDSK